MSEPKPPLLRVSGLVRDYLLPRARPFAPQRRLRALHGVSLALNAGESLGIVGESGCGKSTLARSVLALERPTAGTVQVHGQDVFALDRRALRALRRHLQMIFQDPYGSLDPRQRVARIVAEPLTSLEPETTAAMRRQRVAEALEAVGLSGAAADKYPHEFSGGQRQRIAIARALITRPSLIVADEPVSSLDVSVQAQVLNLMLDLQERLGLSYLFISHDLSIVRCVTDRVAVMYLGRIVEQGPTEAVFTAPLHPYSQALLDAIPWPDFKRRRARVPSAAAAREGPPEEGVGCPYAGRCPRAETRCREALPPLRDIAPQRAVACHLA
jgi:peptide/nickel transport system ATP-binding protein